jgi:hypothetical protein
MNEGKTMNPMKITLLVVSFASVMLTSLPAGAWGFGVSRLAAADQEPLMAPMAVRLPGIMAQALLLAHMVAQHPGVGKRLMGSLSQLS